MGAQQLLCKYVAWLCTWPAGAVVRSATQSKGTKTETPKQGDPRLLGIQQEREDPGGHIPSICPACFWKLYFGVPVLDGLELRKAVEQ